MSRQKGGKHHKKRLPFWKAAAKWGFTNAWNYEMKHKRRYPLYPLSFFPLIILLVVIAIVLFFYDIPYVPILFYVIEIILTIYLMYRLLKRVDRIRIKGSILRLWGLKALSGVISIFGVFLLIFMAFMYPVAVIMTLIGGDSFFAQIVTFGYQWRTPYLIPLLIETIGFSLCVIGAYLLFKFKMRSGNAIWVGRI